MSIVYIDLLFLINLTANYFLLLGAGRVAGVILRRGKIFLGALVGAVYAVATFLPGLEWMAGGLTKLLIGVLMSLIAYAGKAGVLKVSIIFFAVSAGLAGAVLGIGMLGNGTVMMHHGFFYSSTDIRLLLLLFAACYFILSLFFRNLGGHNPQEYLKIELSIGGKTVVLTALKDTGHTLKDPATNRGVIVADYRFLAECLPDGICVDDPIAALKACSERAMCGARLFPFRAVGVSSGLLLAVKAESVRIEGEEQGAQFVAVSPTPLDDGGKYQALIGGELW